MRTLSPHSAGYRPHSRSIASSRRGLLLLAFVAFAFDAAAQSTPDGQMSGIVRDATGGRLAGAVVAIQSPQLIGGVLQLTTAEDGSWRAPALPAGVYDLAVTRAGFRPARLRSLVLSAGKTLVLDLELELEGIIETQHLVAEPPPVDVRSAAVVTNFSASLIENLPTSRTIADLLNLVPGVAGDMAFGGTKRSNGLYVDGVDTTDPAEQGPWLAYNQNWLQDVQVVGLGADAEHGRSTGVNGYAMIQSGADRYSGLAEYWTTRSSWVSDNTSQLSNELSRGFEPLRIASNWDANGQAGGPITRERVWFFAGLEHITDDHAPAGYDGPVLEETDETRAIGKLTGALPDGWRIEGFLQGGRQRALHSGIGPLVAPEATSIRRRPQASWSARSLGRIGPHGLLDLRYTGYDSPVSSEPLTQGGPPGHYNLLTGISTVNALTTDRTDRTRHLVAATGTWYSVRGPGDHELKFGVQSGWARERTTFEYTAGTIYWDFGSEPYLRDTYTGTVAVGKTRHTAFFIQDRWQVGNRVTLLPGLRADLLRGSTSQAAGVLRTNPVSARFGVAWDLFGDHRSVLRAHYGRYTDDVFAQPVLLTDFGQPGETITEAFNASGEWEEISRRSFAGSRRIDPDLQQSYVDQVIVGVERQLLRDLALQTQYIHRAFGNFMGFVHDHAIWVPVQRRDPGPDGLAGTGDDGELLTVYDLSNAPAVTFLYTNPDQARRRYDAWQVVASRRTSDDWQFQASYTWARTRGTIGSGFHVNAGRGDLGQGNGGNPNRLINGDERSPHDPTHEVKLIGFCRPRWLKRINIAGIYRYMSGSAWGRTFPARGLTQGVEQVLAEPRGTRRVQAISNLDLRVELTALLGTVRRVGVFADVFNVTNQGVPDSDWVLPVVTTSGPSLGLPTVWRQPRRLRLSVRLTY